MSYAEEDTCMSYGVSYEEEDTCMSYLDILRLGIRAIDFMAFRKAPPLCGCVRACACV
jgi:hypothetical protein